MFKKSVFFQREVKARQTPNLNNNSILGKPIFKTRQLNMGAGIEQRAWTPTIRRGPIAAEAVTPGPAIVVLPTLIGLHIFTESIEIR